MPYISSRIEVINFKEFMNHEHQKNDTFSRKREKVYSFIPVSPLAFFDPLFLSFAAGILAVSLLERSLANNDHLIIAEVIHIFLKIAFPVVGIGSLFYLLGQLRF